MRRRLGGDGQSFLLRGADEFNAICGRYVLDVEPAPGDAADREVAPYGDRLR